MSNTLVMAKPGRTSKGASGKTGPARGRSRPKPVRAAHADPVRLERLQTLEINYMRHRSFDEFDAEAQILAPMPEPERAGRRVKAPKGLPPYLASLYDDPLLTREQELHLFRQMNYLKHRASTLRDALDPETATLADLDEVDRWLRRAGEVKNRIIQANLRLVVSIAKRHVAATQNFFELVSDGNMSLMRAVEKFDYSRGNKFSTYASWAIMNNFARSIPTEAHRKSRFITGFDEVFESAAGVRGTEHEAEGNHRQLRETRSSACFRVSTTASVGSSPAASASTGRWSRRSSSSAASSGSPRNASVSSNRGPRTSSARSLTNGASKGCSSRRRSLLRERLGPTFHFHDDMGWTPPT
jgi:RNA polymerase sigma factor (sigma-70 family)